MTSITDTDRQPSSGNSLLAPVMLALRLFGRYWPQLMLFAALGLLMRDILLALAVRAGLANALAGMVILSLVVLTKLVVTVLMFTALRPDLPAIRSLTETDEPATADGGETKSPPRVTSIVAIAILPFFAYYAAWGFLGDTVREYSRMALAKVPFGETANFLDLLTSRWLIASIAACWVVRWVAKRFKARSSSPFWPLLVVACDATWIFIGLYAISTWQGALIAWIGSGGFFNSMPSLDGLRSALDISAWAADGNFVPVELQGPGAWVRLQNLFFYALLPPVWLVMTAVVYGYDVSLPKQAAAPAGGATRNATLFGWLKDFVMHFLGGYRSRYMPVVRCIRMVLGAGLPTLIVLIVGYRLIGWAGAWLWVGLTRLIGPHELTTWQLLSAPISLLIGSPVELDGGILLDPLRICLLAAVVERAVAAQTSARIRG